MTRTQTTPSLKKYDGNQDKIFEESVLKGFEIGQCQGRKKTQDSLKRAADQLKDEHIKGYLIHPFTNAREDGNYRQYWDKMKEKSNSYLPKLVETGRWEEFAYDPVLEGDWGLLDDTAGGRLLFKYDSQHSKASVAPSADGAIVTEHRVMLWSEEKEIQNYSW